MRKQMAVSAESDTAFLLDIFRNECYDKFDT